jgi:phosphomannomutase
LAGRKVLEVVTVDGVKLLLEGNGWVLFRKSGTEPVVRVYAEARSAAELAALIGAAVDFVKG